MKKPQVIIDEWITKFDEFYLDVKDVIADRKAKKLKKQYNKADKLKKKINKRYGEMD